MNPLEPIDQAPKDGDFARYVEAMVAHSGQRLAASARADGVAPPPSLTAPVSTLSAPPAPGAVTARRMATTTRSTAPGATSAASGNGPPDITELLSRAASGGLHRVLAAIGGIWLLLGIVAGVRWFADSLFIAMILLFAAAFLRNSRRRAKPPRVDEGSG